MYVSAAEKSLRVAQEVLERQRLDESTIESVLEPAVEAECEDGCLYDRSVNAALLKLYSINPLMFNFDYAKLLLAKCLMEFPKNDFNVALYSIPTSFYTTTTIEDANGVVVMKPLSKVLQNLVALEQLMRECKFAAFWQTIRTDPEIHFLYEINQFKETIQRYIAKLIQKTHTKITAKVLSAMLDIHDPVHLLACFDDTTWMAFYQEEVLYIGQSPNHHNDRNHRLTPSTCAGSNI